MHFVDAIVVKADRFAIGTETISGRHYVSFPVSNGFVDYEEYYEISPVDFASYCGDPSLARPLVAECRRRQHDDLLMVKPGRLRGNPI
jgi:hypothetical protein